MGRVRSSRRSLKKNKVYKKQFVLGCGVEYRRDIDQIQDDVADPSKAPKFDLDDDLPGLGQHYCLTCAKHYADDKTLAAHVKSKGHKRRFDNY